MPRALKAAVPARRSAEREALAQVIADRDAAEAITHRARDAANRAQGLIAEAEAKLADAQAAVEKAREAQARRAVKAAKSGAAPPPDATARNARLAEADAQDSLEAARAASEACVAALVPHERDLEYAQRLVAKAADDVIRAECGSRLFRETEALQAQLIAARVALRYLLGNNQIPEPENKAANTLLGYRQFPSFYGNIEWADHDRHQTTVAWKEAREALMRDAGAPLPGGK